MTNLPCQAMTLYSVTKYDVTMWAIANTFVEVLNKKLTAGKLRDVYVECKFQDIDDRDDSDESVGGPWKEIPYILSASKSSSQTFLVVYWLILAFILHAMMMNGGIVLSQKH